MSKIKNFKDLVFIPHPIAGEAQKLPLYLAKEYAEAKQAKMNFENGYGISVIFGSMFYSNGIDTYEVGILKDTRVRDKDCVKNRVKRAKIVRFTLC